MRLNAASHVRLVCFAFLKGEDGNVQSKGRFNTEGLCAVCCGHLVIIIFVSELCPCSALWKSVLSSEV